MFKEYPIGSFHVDIAQVNTEEGWLFMFVAIDRTSKIAYVEVHEKTTLGVAVQCLGTSVEKVPYTIQTILTDNGSQFTNTRNPKVLVNMNLKIIKSIIMSNAFDVVRSKVIKNIA